MYQPTLKVEVASAMIMSVYPIELLLDHIVTKHLPNGLKFDAGVRHHIPNVSLHCALAIWFEIFKI